VVFDGPEEIHRRSDDSGRLAIDAEPSLFMPRRWPIGYPGSARGG